MFRHKKVENKDKINKKEVQDDKNKVEEKTKKKFSTTKDGEKKEVVKPSVKIENVSADSVHELLEKNLKWSQIIYEQNRKINNKLVWTAVASWLKLLIILIPLIVAFFYLPPLVKDFIAKYGQLLGIVSPSLAGVDTSALGGVFDNLSLDSSQLEQIKTFIGK